MTEYVHGTMDINEQERTFRGFVKFSVRFCVLNAVVVALLAFFLV